MIYKTNGYLFSRIAEAVEDGSHTSHGVAAVLATTFRHLETYFFDNIHPSVDVGLAVDQLHQSYQNNGDHPNIMTLHGCRHVSDLIDSMDHIASHIATAFPEHAINVEEAYLLLCAAHLHDAGNVGGRKDHATRSSALIEDHKDLILGTERREQVFEVSQVHGGTDPVFGRDTLRSLSSDNYRSPRLPLLAAILRMGDELSENPERVPKEVEAFHNASGESTLAYRYAETFRSFKLEQGELFVTIKIYPTQHNCSAIVGTRTMTFYDYLERRLDKMEKEIRYCSQYSRPYLTVRRIRVSIACHDSDRLSRPARVKRLTLELESGYPQLPPLARRCDELRQYDTLEEYCRGGAK